MPERATVQKAKRALRSGKRPSTAAGEFVREEIHHVREGKHGARSTKQAIAIGLSKARRAGVPLPAPARSKAKRTTRASAQRAYAAGPHRGSHKPSPRRSRAVRAALQREPHRTVSRRALSKQAHRAAIRRGPAARSAAARKAAATKGPRVRRAAARKAARTRRRHH